MTLKPALKEASKYDRVPPRRAIIGLSENDNTDQPDGESLLVDRAGGLFNQGMLRRISLCSRGEALGHYFWVDDVMLQQIADLAIEQGKLKSRFTHPDWCEDGTGKALGVITDVRYEGDQVYGDLSFSKAAHRAPDGDLAGYVMDFADETPEMSGLSIVFCHDWEAEELFEAENMETTELKDEAGNVIETRQRFVSPDPLNVDNMPHARILELYAADFVDDPAANPNGLFHRPNELLSEGRSILDFVLGRSTEAPKLSALGSIAPERLKSFVSRYLAQQGLTIEEIEAMPQVKGSLTKGVEKKLGAKKLATGKEAEKKEPESTSLAEGETEKKDDEEAASEDDEEAPAKKDPADEEPEKKDDDEEMSSGLAGFCEMFGNDKGATYFLANMDFTEALKAEVISLRASLKEATDKLAAFGELGLDPVKFQAAPAEKGKSVTTEGGEQLSARDRFTALNKATVAKK
jgi:hypothetical protein